MALLLRTMLWGKVEPWFNNCQSYFCKKETLLKNFLYTIGLLLLISSCNEATSNIQTAGDSLQHPIANPPQLDQAEFHHYNEIVSSFFDSFLIKKGFSGGILVAKNGIVV